MSPIAPPAMSSATVVRVKKALSVAASVAATAVLLRTFAKEFQFQSIFSSLLSKLSIFSDDLTLVIEKSDAPDAPNEIYAASEAYLGSIAPASTRRLRINKLDGDTGMHVTLDSGETVLDAYNGVEFTWILTNRKTSDTPEAPDVIELSFPKKHKELALKSYLPHIVKKWWAMKVGERPLKLHMLRYETWYSVDLDHPATFETLAMDPEVKRVVVEDLDRFVATREDYRRIGKPWRRGYLLHGPAGSGKSSLVAAMANHLKFDVYDLDLAEVPDASVLRTVIAATTSRSIIVVEDADVVAEGQAVAGDDGSVMGIVREGVTLEGVLCSVEGLWSGCGDERIVVFTAEKKEAIEAELLRPGRMDVHVHMSYCTPSAFRMIARNYVGLEDHPSFPTIERLLEEVDATPAEVAAELAGGADLDVVLRQLANALEEKKGDPLLRVL